MFSHYTLCDATLILIESFLWGATTEKAQSLSLLCVCSFGNPLPSNRQHLSYDVCLEVRGRLSELFCVVLCTEVAHSHKHT